MLDEQLVPISKVRFGHVSTVYRWWKRGIRGIKLETILVGGRRFTSQEALQRFSQRTTHPAVADVDVAWVKPQGIEAAERKADELGL